jgi:hypothetical protein
MLSRMFADRDVRRHREGATENPVDGDRAAFPSLALLCHRRHATASNVTGIAVGDRKG